MTDWLGWIATALFTGSYFCRDAAALRRVQIAAALLWIGYGLSVQALPVIVANVLLVVAATVATFTGVRRRAEIPRKRLEVRG